MTATALLLVAAAFAALGALALVALELAPDRRALRASLHRVSQTHDAAAPARRDRAHRRRVAGALWEVTPRRVRAAAERRLEAAGLARRVPAASYLAFKAGLIGAGTVGGALLGGGEGGAARGLLLAVLFASLGALLPDRFLALAAAKRRERIRASLPNALDLLAVFVEAGLGLDAALGRIAGVARGPLAEEFTAALGEMRAGVARADALRAFAERVAVPEAGAFVRAVLQAAELGSSVAGTLRAQAADARHRRQAEVEERVGRAPVQMLFPTVVFIFPAMFVVVLGPAVMTLAKLL